MEKNETLLKIIDLMKERATFVKDIYSQGKFFFEAPTSYDEKAAKKAWNDETASIMTELTEKLINTEFNADLLKDPLCLNLIVGGKGTRSQQTIDKISKSNTGKQHTEETKQKIRKIRLGSSHTEKTKQLMSSQRKGKIVSSETLSKMRDSMQTAIYKTPDGEFKSYYHASEFYGITPTGMKKRFKSTINIGIFNYIITVS